MKHIIRAVFTLTFFSIIDRVLGFGFKIYLSREMGAASMGVYQVALSIFFLLLTATTSGVPLIVSKLTAKFKTQRDSKSEYSTVSAAILVGIVSSVLVCGIILLFQTPIAKLFASPESMTILLLLLPGVIFSGVYAAFRGNMWGKERYTASSVIEVLEQIIRIILCIILFLLGLDKLKATAITMSVACAFTMLACIAYYLKGKGKLLNPKGYIAPLLKSSVPITCVRASGSVVNSLIAIAVPFLLTMSGNSNEQAMYIFGASIGMALPLLYIPITVVGSLAYVMIPSLSAAYTAKNTQNVRKQIETALSFSIVVAALFIPIFWVLGESLGSFIYENVDSGKFLSAAAWLLIPLSFESIASSMLNSLDLEKEGFINYLIGSVVLFAILFCFMKSFTINVLVIGLGISWIVSAALDVWCIKKRTGIKLTFIWPLVISSALVFPASFLTKTVFTLCESLPLLASIGIASFVGLAFMFSLSIVFGLIDLSVIFGKRKKLKKPLKTFATS